MAFIPIGDARGQGDAKTLDEQDPQKLAQLQRAQQPLQPAQPTQPTQPAQPANPFADHPSGGGVQLPTGEWVPLDHPLAAQAAPQQHGSNGVSNAPQTPEQAAQAAQTYSQNPGGAPTQNTSNQGTQDVYRNTLLQRATQKEGVDRNDPAFRSVADTYAAASERARRNATDMEAERLGATGNQNGAAMDSARRMETERASQDQASFESQLALRELDSQRAEIMQALNSLGDTISGDQQRALMSKLAELDAAIKRESIASANSLGHAELALRGDLGNKDLSLREMLGRLSAEVDRERTAATSSLGHAELAVRSALGGGDLALRGELGRSELAMRELLGRLGDSTQRYSIDQSAALGRGDLALRGELGRGSLAMQDLALRLQDQQARNSLAANIGFNEAQLNNAALRTMLGL